MNDDGPGHRPTLDDLDRRLREGRQSAGLEPKGPARRDMAGAGQGLRAGIEFFVATCVGAGLGYGIGLFAGSEVIGLVVGLFVGFAAGIRNMIRLTTPDNRENEGNPQGDTDRLD